MTLSPRAVLTAAVSIGLMSAAATPLANADWNTHTLVLIQQVPSLRPISQGSAGSSVGDVLLYEAAITGEHGESGTLTGFSITADIADPENGDLDTDRLSQLSFDLGNSNTLLAAGSVRYRGDNAEIAAGAPQLRPVVGGTGTFMGARGQVSTTRDIDGSYRHEFTLIDG